MTDTAEGDRPVFQADTDIALKVPSALFDEMVAFYAETLGLPVTPQGTSVKVAFGPCTLWLDNVPAITQPELWLKVTTPDTARAADFLAERGVRRCDEVEELPSGFDGFWASGPGGVIHLIAGRP